MASLSTTALLDFLSLTSAQRSQVEPIISEFNSFLMAKKQSARPSTLAKVFPLVFGDNAIIKGSPLYEEHWTQPWYPLSCSLSHSSLRHALSYLLLFQVPKLLPNPTVILTPITRKQVTQILALTHSLGVTFSIRGGGHLQNPGVQ
jgi:hypothetical protein